MMFQNKVSHLIIARPYSGYYNLKIEVTFAEVKCQLSQKEHKQVERSGTAMNTEDASPSTFVVEGLELKEIQYVILRSMVYLI
jgi:hypothetical protein